MQKPGSSIVNMAEAMLDDDYKSSHTSLKEWGDENEKKDQAERDRQQQIVEGTPQKTNPDETRQENTNDDKKSDVRSVVIQVPPKRRKISNACGVNTSEVVDGKFVAFVLLSSQTYL
jgi:hypothetical protein